MKYKTEEEMVQAHIRDCIDMTDGTYGAAVRMSTHATVSLLFSAFNGDMEQVLSYMAALQQGIATAIRSNAYREVASESLH